jgi:hypothetical protein
MDSETYQKVMDQMKELSGTIQKKKDNEENKRKDNQETNEKKK